MGKPDDYEAKAREWARGEWPEHLIQELAALLRSVAEDARREEAAKIYPMLTRVAQLLDGWHQDGTAWTEWDESVRAEVSKVLCRGGEGWDKR